MRMIQLICAVLLMGLLCVPALAEEETTVTPNWENVKPLGRTHCLENCLWLAHSASGAEFTFTGTKVEIVMLGDNSAPYQGGESNRARIAIEVDGERLVDDLLDEKEKTYTLTIGDMPREAVVRVTKLSESLQSTCGIKCITVDSADGLVPTATKERRIEFIGDSITCGYGVDDEDRDHHFSTATEDATRAYAFLTAQKLDADWSLVSFSGHGIISGYTATGDGPVTSQRVPDYYDLFGHSFSWFGSQSADQVKWDFSAFEPDVIVINLGTNDDSYTLNQPERRVAYRDAYVAFLKDLRGHNPNAKLVCALGIMGDRLYTMVDAAVKCYTEETGDENVACVYLFQQSAADGYAADWHPTAKTHEKAATRMAEQLRRLMGWN